MIKSGRRLAQPYGAANDLKSDRLNHVRRFRNRQRAFASVGSLKFALTGTDRDPDKAREDGPKTIGGRLAALFVGIFCGFVSLMAAQVVFLAELFGYRSSDTSHHNDKGAGLRSRVSFHAQVMDTARVLHHTSPTVRCSPHRPFFRRVRSAPVRHETISSG